MSPEGAARQIQEAIAYYDLRRYKEAVGVLRQALAQEPTNATAHAYLAMCLGMQSTFANPQPALLAEALREAKTAIASRPDLTLGYSTLAWVNLRQGKPDEALVAAAQVLRINPEAVSGWELSSDALMEKKEYIKALQTAESGLQLAPESVSLLNDHSFALIHLGRAGEARHSVEAALKLDPANREAHTNHGWLALMNNDPAGALGHFRTALRLNPLSEESRRGMLEALKAHNPLYRLLFRYSLWASRFTGSEMLIVLTALASVSTVLSTMASVFFPLYLIYFPWRLFYGLFTTFSWISDVIFIALLRFSPAGRQILTRQEISASTPFLVTLAYGLANLGLGIGLRQWGFLGGVALSVGMLIPSGGVYILRDLSMTRRAIFASLAGLTALIGFLAQLLLFVSPLWAIVPAIFFGLGWLSLPWIANLLLAWE